MMGTVEAKANPAKKEAVAALEEKFSQAQSIFFTDYRGLSVAQMNDLRHKFFEAGGAEYLVAKNTLMRIALSNGGITLEDDEVLAGPTGVGLGFDDPVTPAKVIADYARDHKKLVFKGGLVDGEFYDIEKVKKLADLPPVEQLYAMIVGGVSSPLSGLVGVLNETVRSFVGVLDAIIEQKKAAGEQ
jgi:large subunit ribosomal protein L10